MAGKAKALAGRAIMKLNYAQKAFLKFVAISQLYVALAVLALVAFGAVIKLPWETSWIIAVISVLSMFGIV